MDIVHVMGGVSDVLNHWVQICCAGEHLMDLHTDYWAEKTSLFLIARRLRYYYQVRLVTLLYLILFY